jgi:hypothetical protein
LLNVVSGDFKNFAIIFGAKGVNIKSYLLQFDAANKLELRISSSGILPGNALDILPFYDQPSLTIVYAVVVDDNASNPKQVLFFTGITGQVFEINQRWK